jgi:cytochrome b561
MIAILLAICALFAAGWCLTLLFSQIRTPVETSGGTTLVDRWHVWMGISLAAAAVSRVAWGVTQRPKNLE